MTPAEAAVLKETKLFRAAVPSLMKEHAGRWVVFRKGEVQAIHGTLEDAYSWALGKFGNSGDYVVAPVATVKPTPVTASVMFGAK